MTSTIYVQRLATFYTSALGPDSALRGRYLDAVPTCDLLLIFYGDVEILRPDFLI